MDLQELIARESIRDLVARYNANGDSGRLDQMMELFAEDAVMQIDGGDAHEGRAAIRRFFESAVDGFADVEGPVLVRHSVTTHVIDVTGPETATGRAYFTVFLADGPDHWGRYVDDYRRVDGLWRFAKRRVSTDGRVPGGWADRRRDIR
jgi:uncharacterized protein (TIGR02246 family)